MTTVHRAATGMRLWDRGRFLVALVAAFLVLTWKTMADFEGIMPFDHALQYVARAYPWIFWVAAAETVRQAHLLLGERSSGYHRFWSQKVFGGFERWSHRRFGAWTRFRVARAVKMTFWVVLVALVLGAILEVSPFVALFRAAAPAAQALPFVLQVFFLIFVIIVPVAGLLWFLSRGGVDTRFPDDVKTRFADVWGQDHVVERLREDTVFLENPDAIEAGGGYVPGGLLLWGPPGTGKTLMAQAVAGETGKPYVFVDPGAFTTLFRGIGVLKMKALFRKLRKLALRYGGVVVFFDEADSLGRPARQGPPAQRDPSGCHGLTYLSAETRSILAFHRPVPGATRDSGALRALLTELSGLHQPRGLLNRHVRRALGMRPKPPPKYRVLVIMAADRPDALHEALLRPGRIDRVYKVGHPSRAGRIRTYQGYFGKVAHRLTPGQIGKLATLTPHATGAAVKDLVNESLIIAVRDGRQVVTWSDVLRAKRLKQLGPPEDVEYLDRERHAVAVHEACHAVAAHYTRHRLEIDVVTIEKGADHLGMVAAIKPEDRFTRWKSEYEADIMVSLASLAGERMFFGEDSSSGVSGDLRAATFLTALMESCWGMGSGLTSLPALQELEITGGAPGEQRIEVTLVRLLERAERLLREHRREVLSVAHALETHRTLDGDDVVAVIERRAGPLLDGTVYASEQLWAELEDYHREAARAHREHGRIERDLPGSPRKAKPVSTDPAPFTPSGPPAVPDRGGTAQPEFVAWTPEPQPTAARHHPRPPAADAAPGRRGAGRTALITIGSLLGLVVVALLGGLAVTRPGASMELASPGLLVLMAVFVVAVIVGSCLAVVTVRGLRAAQAKVERERDQAHARAQLLAAAMDPDTAMRLLGYDGGHRPGA
ncbi:AAA family ATPase [Nonomuraea typhae]|uniref:AAA family ATPase n=1 Tax=Nonomuraea typhae TaxID=2603600 RepID=A0ABW7YK39_9ACTN